MPRAPVHAPIWQNHAFLTSLTDTAFREWSRGGIVSIKELYVNEQLSSFEQLQSKYSLTKPHFFRHLQLRHYVQQVIKSYKPLSGDNALFKSLLGSPDAKHLILNLVCYFSSNLDTSTVKMKQAWESELNVEIGDDS